MWLILMGENCEGGSVRRTLPWDATNAEVVSAMRELAVATDYSTAEWIRADLWEANATNPLLRIRAEDVGILPREI